MRTVYAIRNTAGETIAEHVRVDWPNGRKRMYWQIPGCDPRDGLMGVSTPDLPLYGSEHIPSFHVAQPVVICEGERARDALWSLGIAALATVTGAASTPGEDALAVLLAFNVVLWPDHDREGWAHMNRVAWRLHQIGAYLPRYVGGGARFFDGTYVHFVLPRGFDAADAVSPRAIHRLIDAAQPWDLHRESGRPAPQPSRPSYRDAEDRVQSAKSHMAEVAIQKLGQPRKQDRRSMWWPCPFHQDRTPSFKVDLAEPYYVCFGCGARGDVFTFLREIEGVAFKDAIRELAPPVGLGALPRIWS